MKGGIYLIRNLVNGKVYIGQTQNFASRKGGHLYTLRKKLNQNYKLQADFDEFGEVAFEFVPFCYAPKEGRLALEKLFIDNWPGEKYNVTVDEQGFSERFHRNKHSKETREKASASMKEFYKTDKGKQEKRKRAEKLYELEPWKRVTPEERKVIGSLGSKARTENGYRHSEETKKKMSDSQGTDYIGAVSPTGEVFAPIHNMSKFCREHGLGVSSMVGVMNERRKTHKGWSKYTPKVAE